LKYLLGADIGTTSLKASVFDTDGNMIKATASTNTVTFNFDSMVIDCGTYDPAE
jgi:sugar (pentulose or hexulose) kinase